MERKKQFSFSTILMFVGILFIIVAGGIFVSGTWQYLPESVKKFVMALLTGGLFAGSFFAEEKWNLKKTSTALYYLGICFTGYTAFSFVNAFLMDICGSLIIAMLGMSVPVIARFLQKKHWLDSLFEMFLLDGITICLCVSSLEDAALCGALTASCVTLLLAFFTKYCKDFLPEETGMQIGALTFFGIHTGLLLPALLMILTDSRNFLFTVLPALLITAAFSLLYRTYRSTLLRVFQSLSFMYLSLTVAVFTVMNFCVEYVEDFKTELIFFVAFLLNLVWMIVLDRKELFIANGAYALWLSLIQIICFMINNSLRGNGNEDALYLAYSLSLAIALVFWYVLRKRESSCRPLLQYIVLLLLTEANSFLAYVNEDYSNYYSFAFWFAMMFLQVAFFCRSNRILKAIFETFALGFALMGLIAEPILPVQFHAADGTVIADFAMEYSAVFVALSIVLFGFIWYDYKKVIRVIQLISTCLLLAVLLIGNLVLQELPNVLFLGISMLIMLVAASVLKQKAYAIASAVTLTLVALYLTRAFWLSITWWVYLFAAGVALVIFAVKRERDEKKVSQI